MMPATELGPQFQFASWRVSQFARAIEYPLEVMEEIRAFACDELLQLSHGGDEVGGVLFGTRRDDLIRILTWRPIACEHAQGEGLRLSYTDRMNLAVQLEVARQNSDLKDLRPLGWFVSHLRDDVSLSPSDLEIYNGFFPDASQVALVICPKGNGRAKAGFFVREANEQLRSESSYQCFDLAPLRLSPTPEPTAAPETAAVPVKQVQAPPPAPQPPPPAKPFARIEPRVEARVEPRMRSPRVQEAPAPLLPPPSFQIEERVPTHERWLWAIPIVLALGIAAFLLYQRSGPASNTAIALHAFMEAQTIQLAWNGNSRALRDSDHAAIEIDDGGKTSQVSLTGDQLHAGKMSYLPQSSDIGFVMTVYPANGDPIHDSTRLIAPAFNSPTQPPQLLPANPLPGSAPASPAATHDALGQQVQQLKEALGRERARADELQNLVRILETRLGIPYEAPKPPPHRTEPQP